MTLDRFYPIVNTAEWVERLSAAGARMIKLHIKDAEPHHVRSEIRFALAACKPRGAQLIVNDHWRAAIDEGADFVHLGRPRAWIAATGGASVEARP